MLFIYLFFRRGGISFCLESLIGRSTRCSYSRLQIAQELNDSFLLEVFCKLGPLLSCPSSDHLIFLNGNNKIYLHLHISSLQVIHIGKLTQEDKLLLRYECFWLYLSQNSQWLMNLLNYLSFFVQYFIVYVTGKPWLHPRVRLIVASVS